MPAVSYRAAGPDDIPLLARMNHSLIRDEGSENLMDVEALAERMRAWLTGEYHALLVLCDGEIMGYCLYRTENAREIYVRQYYILPGFRRKGLGKQAFLTLAKEVFTGINDITLDVLEGNSPGKAFWESMGFIPVWRHMRRR